MSLYRNRATFDALRSVAAGSITSSFVALGSELPVPAVCLTFKNNTNGDVIVSTDGVNDMLYLPTNSFNVYDIRTNGPYDTDFMFPQGTQFYVTQGTNIPSTGSFYIEAVIVTRTN
jgi:hypothetical protein